MKTDSAPPGNSHQKTLKKWRVDSKSLAAPVDSEKNNENKVSADWEIINEKPSKDDARIRKRSQPLLT